MPDPEPLLTSGFAKRLRRDLMLLYGDMRTESELDTLLIELVRAAGIELTSDDGIGPVDNTVSDDFWNTADEVMLIAYGNSIAGFDPALSGLQWLLDEVLNEAITAVHVLPFFPYSSDGGFAIVDYYQADPALGTLSDLSALAERQGAGSSASRRQMMADIVINHASAQNPWFQQFVAGEAPGRDWFKTASPLDDLSDVVRPRSLPLLKPVETPDGVRHVWCTFSPDQVDFDLGNPEVLIEFARIQDHLLRQGITRVRLDAIAYLWKEVGTSCIHLPQTHAVVRILRTLLNLRAPEVLVITETNVPHAENVSYFGDGDEAHLVYNFSLVPLTLHAALSGDATPFLKWAERLGPQRPHTTWLNFLASHDGLGVRPAEGLLNQAELDALVAEAEAAGGTWSPYATPDGDRPYELNVSLADLLGGPDFADGGRYLAAHAVMLAFAGSPAIYVNSMLVTSGAPELAAETGVRRDINRGSTERAWVEDLAAGRLSERSRVFGELVRLIALRRAQAAFAPASPQTVFWGPSGVIGLVRGAADAPAGQTNQRILAVTNMQAVNVDLPLPGEFVGGRDLLDPDTSLDGDQVPLGPWQTRWIEAIG